MFAFAVHTFIFDTCLLELLHFCTSTFFAFQLRLDVYASTETSARHRLCGTHHGPIH